MSGAIIGVVLTIVAVIVTLGVIAALLYLLWALIIDVVFRLLGPPE